MPRALAVPPTRRPRPGAIRGRAGDRRSGRATGLGVVAAAAADARRTNRAHRAEHCGAGRPLATLVAGDGFSEPLGRELGSLAPAGTIGLSGPPIEGSRSGPELVGRPAQQRTAVQRMATATTASSQAPTDTPLPSGLPPSAPQFHAAVVESPAPAVQRSLTSAADAVGAAAGEAAADPGPGRRPELAAFDLGRARAQFTSVVPVQREPTGARATTAGRRLGLGAPLAGSHGRLPLQRAARVSATASVDSPVPADRPARVPVQRLALDQLPVGHPAAVSRASASPNRLRRAA